VNQIKRVKFHRTRIVLGQYDPVLLISPNQDNAETFCSNEDYKLTKCIQDIECQQSNWNRSGILPNAESHFEHGILFKCDIGPRLAAIARDEQSAMLIFKQVSRPGY
jgi:hypothetical protein